MDRETILDEAVRRTEDVHESSILIMEKLFTIMKSSNRLGAELKGLLSDYQTNDIDEDTVKEWMQIHLTTFNEEIEN